ncbi:AAA family ATPase [Leifsonia sp. TF02-11]|uniref:AAA family ATPase n=1 Tax=Leifsonia sp. TF02-11 TaxID=2815212 RepID=UPI001AA17205|nr:AAA family ATPase [Leifsonia sp. TF02-11]MBO1740741.1 AAA family ATPase [Leifsonia sp. TF02-11]
MRGGLERWKRGAESDGVRQAVSYAFEGICDAARGHRPLGVEHAVGYGDAGTGTVDRFTVTGSGIDQDRLDAQSLARWVDGADPETGQPRGRVLTSPDADLFLDATMNMPKSYSLAVLLDPELRDSFEAMQDRIRDRTLTLWQRELNARRGAGGLIREPIARLEVVELRHERSRALDPHIHRHLWLGVKVLGDDGQWSNVDSRVAMKLHTVVNAEGDLASRTDPAWIASLAAHGFTLDADGEIAELAHLVRPLSRRSNQIEANRALQLAHWRQAHPGQQPDHAVLAAIDRWAWAQHRPGKPEDLDEAAWQDLIRSEIAVLDPNAAGIRRPVQVKAVRVGELDRDLLAARAVADADRRSAGCGGRFSRYDVRAGAVRAIAASGVIADRDVLGEVVDDVVGRALQNVVDFLDGEPDVPSHVKHLMSLPTAQDKLDLADRFDHLNKSGLDVPAKAISQLATEILEENTPLDPGQTAAAAAVAGTSRLVTVTGPAGTGKTTLLRVARRGLQEQGRSMIVVAPTRKGATVAGRDIGTAASSLHALLVDHGYRFADDATGRTVWTRLAPGDTDPVTAAVFRGPRRYPIRAGDRIVVDEAGMVDLQAANALAQLALDTGAGIAMIGDHLQALPVGHSGAMATMQRRSGSVVELTAVHRFRDPDYAALTLRLRNPADHAEAVAAARELAAAGHVEIFGSEHEARERMVAAWLEHAARGKRIALVTATNAEAQQINDRIQQERLDRRQLDASQVAIGQHGQALLVGDIVQTRRNDTDTGVDNRATWTITRIRKDCIELAAVGDSGDRRTITASYAAEHVHLAYASTVHGIQGETVHAAYTGPGVDAAGLYVGMTRGRASNTALTIARDAEKAIEQLADTMLRGRLEVTLDDARRAAYRELGHAAREPQRQRLAAQAAEADARARALQDALREIDARAATLEAAGHGRPDSLDDVIQETAADREILHAAFAAAHVRREALVRGIRTVRAGNREDVTASANPWETDPFAAPEPGSRGPTIGR